MDDVQLLAIGAAAVIDTVILLSMLERPNRARMAVWMLVLMFAAWLWHVSSFVHYLLLLQTTYPWALELKWVSRVCMCLTLLMLPSALLHGILKLRRWGVQVRQSTEFKYLWAYLPCLLVIPLAMHLSHSLNPDFIDSVAGYQTPYIIWMTIVNVWASVVFFRLRHQSDLPAGSSFFVWIAVTYLFNAIFIAVSVLYVLKQWPDIYGVRLGLTLSPVIPVLVFAYYCVRFRFVPLVLERTLVYGAIVVGFLLFHKLVISDINARLSDRLRFDVGIVEAIAVIGLVLAYQPLRQRISESLHYLLGRDVGGVRIQTRRLSVELSARTGGNPSEICQWVEQQLINIHSLTTAEVLVSVRGDSLTHAIPAAAVNLVAAMQRSNVDVCSRNGVSQNLVEALEAVNSSAAIVRQHADVEGLLLIGRKAFNRSLDEEDLNTVILLFEQLLVTIRNGQLQSMRLEAERRALQNEKLSMMGLLAGSIAHEIKNPLSSIKTITTVMAEDLKETDHSEDLELVLGEINRLSDTTQDLLAFARPDDDSQTTTCPLNVLRQIERIVSHSARERGVKLKFDCGTETAAVMASDNALKQIYFNLILNSLDAVDRNGTVYVGCQVDDESFVTKIEDDGSGISADIQNHLFEPFQTDKVNGTGLGLYIVGQRVKELGGVIECRSSDTGTTFEVRLPCGKKK